MVRLRSHECCRFFAAALAQSSCPDDLVVFAIKKRDLMNSKWWSVSSNAAGWWLNIFNISMCVFHFYLAWFGIWSIFRHVGDDQYIYTPSVGRGSAWWFQTWLLFSISIGNKVNNWRTHIFRWVGQPPTRYIISIIHTYQNPLKAQQKQCLHLDPESLEHHLVKGSSWVKPLVVIHGWLG